MATDEFHWLEDDKEVFLPVKVARVGKEWRATKENGETTVLTDKQREELIRVHPSCLQSIPDMIHLEDMSEKVILHTLRSRYRQQQIYTHISTILISINPYQLLPIYGEDLMEAVKNNRRPGKDKVPSKDGPSSTADNPHPFLLAANAHRNMVQRGEHQSVIISGESGAGKTEATKIILKYLSYLSESLESKGSPRKGASIEQQLLEANPIIEAFGNAQTVRNNNSSRFGKWIEVHFDSQHKIIGGSISHYLLEKSRVTIQAPGERNYHIFHQIIAAANSTNPDPRLVPYRLNGNAAYAYTSSARDTAGIDGVPDAEGFKRTCKALEALDFSSQDITCMWDCLAAILSLGNVPIKGDQDKAQIDEKHPSLRQAAELFGISVERLQLSLSTAEKAFGRETVRTQFNLADAKAGRDAIARHVYGAMFDWLIQFLNQRLKSDKFVFASIGILDIFGFEIFSVNLLEQFLINFANEKLQQHFNHFVFVLEQEEYKVEGLSLPYVEFRDNKEILAMIEDSPNGILPLLDEELRMPKGDDLTYLDKLYAKHRGKRSFRKPQFTAPTFTVRHYAGDVSYTVDGFMVKNKNALSDDQRTLISTSTKPFFANLVPPPVPEDSSARPSSKKGSKFVTLSLQFRQQLASLMTKLRATSPHFIRCIKPNNHKAPSQFDAQLVLQQLRYAGIEAVIRVRQTGFPVRHHYNDFLARFRLLAPSKSGAAGSAEVRSPLTTLEAKDRSKAILDALEVKESEYGLGSTKLFLTHERHLDLESRREDALKRYAIVLQAAARAMRARRLLFLMKRAKAQLQEDLSLPRARSLGELLQESIFLRLAKHIAHGTQVLPAHVAELGQARQLLENLNKKEQERLELARAAESSSRELDFFQKALDKALAVGQDMETLPEYQLVVNTRRKLELELEREKEEARKAAERAARKEKAAKEKAEREEKKRLADQLAKEKAAEMKTTAASKEPEELPVSMHASDEEGEERDEDSADSLDWTETESERKKQMAELEAERTKLAQERERLETERKERDARLKEEEARAEREAKEEEKREGQLQTLRRRVAVLEQENNDIRDLYRVINEDLLRRVEDFDKYKQRVNLMEKNYLEKIQRQQYKLTLMEKARHQGAEGEGGGMARLYLQRVRALEKENEKGMQDLVSKCDQLLQQKMENEEMRNLYDHQVTESKKKDQRIETLEREVKMLRATLTDAEDKLQAMQGGRGRQGSLEQAGNVRPVSEGHRPRGGVAFTALGNSPEKSSPAIQQLHMSSTLVHAPPGHTRSRSEANVGGSEVSASMRSWIGASVKSLLSGVSDSDTASAGEAQAKHIDLLEEENSKLRKQNKKLRREVAMLRRELNLDTEQGVTIFNGTSPRLTDSSYSESPSTYSAPTKRMDASIMTPPPLVTGDADNRTSGGSNSPLKASLFETSTSSNGTSSNQRGNRKANQDKSSGQHDNVHREDR